MLIYTPHSKISYRNARFPILKLKYSERISFVPFYRSEIRAILIILCSFTNNLDLGLIKGRAE